MIIIGWVGSILLAVSSVPQMFKTVRDGHADGLSSSFIASWFIGEVLSLIYVVPIGQWPLITNYGLNLAILSVIGYYKIWPRSSRSLNTLTKEERHAIINQIREN